MKKTFQSRLLDFRNQVVLEIKRILDKKSNEDFVVNLDYPKRKIGTITFNGDSVKEEYHKGKIIEHTTRRDFRRSIGKRTSDWWLTRLADKLQELEGE